MALVKCKECGKEISSTIKQCPNCGYTAKNQIVIANLIIFIALSIFIFFEFRSCGSSSEQTVNQAAITSQSTAQTMTMDDRIKVALQNAIHKSHVSASGNNYETTFDSKTKLLTVICSKNFVSDFSNALTVISFIEFYINLSEEVYKIDDVNYILVAKREEFVDFYGNKVQGYNIIIRTNKKDFLAFNWEGFRHTGVSVFRQLKSASQKFYFHNQVLKGVSEREIILE
jgi:hypothetical protein